jgi:hypothetical protein
MNRIAVLILCAVLLPTLSLAQNMSVIKTDGGVEQFSLADIDSVTFNLLSPDGANDKMKIHTEAVTLQLLVGEIDSLYFSDDGTTALFQTARGLSQLALSEIDSITFDCCLDTTVYVVYEDTAVSVTNPLELLGVSVDVSGADVVVNSAAGISEIDYVLSGTTGDGTFKVYSDKKLELHLNDVQITNPDGPAINIQTGKKISVHLENGTTNILTDGATYADPPGDEDQDAAFFSEGQLIFDGSGTLEINGYGEDEHGLRSDDYIEIDSGTIIVNSAVKDGIHANDGFFMTGGGVDVTSDGDGIDGSDGPIEIGGGSITIASAEADNDAMKCDSTIVITGGTISITVDGDQSKGLNSKQDIVIAGGTLNINTTGGVVLEPSGSGYDPSYCTAIKSDGDVLIDSCSITINASGPAGRGISSGAGVSMGSGTLDITSSGNGGTYTDELGETDAYHGPCIKADGNVGLTCGELTLHHSGNAGKGISADGQISIGTTLAAPLVAHGPAAAPEVGVDVNGSFVVSGGLMVVSGTNSNMTEGPSPSSTQYSVLLRTNQKRTAGTLFHIEDTGGTGLLTFAPMRDYYSIIFSSSQLVGGTTYRVYTGGSSTGTELNGLYTGGVYSGGTLRITFTLSSVSQTVWF